MENLIKKSEFFKTIDLVITPVILVEENSHLYLNKAFGSQIGYRIEQVPDKSTWFEKAYPFEDYRHEVIRNWDRRIESAKSKGEPNVHMVAKVCCADGSYKWFDIHENTFDNKKIIAFLDVDEIQKDNEGLADVLNQKDILLSIIAHDVRSPLSNIRQIINNYKSLDLSAQETEDMFFSMGTQIDYIFNIIDSLLVRTSANNGSFIEKREHIHLKTFFSKYQKYYKERMQKQDIDFIFELHDGLYIDFDPFILDVICRNLIDNAIKYSPENGSIYITFDKTANGDELVIRDVGPGMSATQIERILSNEGSHRLKDQITDSFGLGLVMAKEILEKHHGKLLIKSEPGKGTSFVINLFHNSIENI